MVKAARGDPTRSGGTSAGKTSAFDALAKRINGLQEPLMIEWE